MKLWTLICGCLFCLTVNGQQPVKKLLSPAFKTSDGKTISFSQLTHKLTAVVFLSPDCPLSRNYSLVLKELQQTRKHDLQIIGVFPGMENNAPEINAYREKYKINFDLAGDKKETLVRFTHATITPEVFLYDSKGVLQYSGAIDDWALRLGKKKRQAEQHYLRDAIDNYLQNKKVSPSETQAVGCFIGNK